MALTSRAQGTIEYLVVIAIIVVFGLIVVGLISQILDGNATTINSSKKISMRSGPISITDVAVDAIGSGLISLGNNTGENLVISKINFCNYDNVFSESLSIAEEKIFSLLDLNSCACSGYEGKLKESTITIYAINQYGIEDKWVVPSVFDCVPDASLMIKTNPVHPIFLGADNEIPTVTLLNPTHNYSFSSLPQDLSFNVHDNKGNISLCKLIIDGIVNQTMSAPIQKDNSVSFSLNSLSSGTHTWDVNCIDNNSNQGRSSNGPRTIIYTPTDTRQPIALWAQKMTGSYVEVHRVATDVSGNVYALGSFSAPTVDINGTVLTSAGSDDLFLAKYSSSGILVWARAIGGTGYEGSWSGGLDIDSSGNVFLTASTLSSSINFGNGISLNGLNTSYGSLFILKLNSSGNAIWARSGLANFGAVGEGIKVDSSGNIYVAGDFGANLPNTLTLDSITVTSSSGTSMHDIFLAKYNSSGTIQWAKSATSVADYHEAVNGLALDSSDQPYVAGNFQANTDFGNGVVAVYNGEFEQPFLVKYNSSGIAQWVRTVTGTNVHESNASKIFQSVSIDNLNNIFVAGSFETNDLNFGSAGMLTNSSPPSPEIFFAKYDSSGNVLIAKGMRGTGYDIGRGGFGDSFGNNYIIAHFTSPTLDLNGASLTLTGSVSGFVAKYNSSGQLVWTKQALSSELVAPFGAAFDGNNIIYGGRYYNDANFGNGVILTNPSSFWAYVVKIGQQ